MKTSVKEDLKRAMTTLGRDHRLALLLSYADGLTIEEIATVMRISADQAQTLLLEAIEAIGINLEAVEAA